MCLDDKKRKVRRQLIAVGLNQMSVNDFCGIRCFH
jgi:hypothetical protein